MSDSDGSWTMDPFRKLTNRQLDDLVAGQTPRGVDGLDELAALFAAIRTEPSAVEANLASSHIAAAAQEAARHVPTTSPAVAGRRALRPRRPIPVLSSLLSTTLGKSIVGLAVATIGFGTAGLAGATPSDLLSPFSGISAVFSDDDGDTEECETETLAGAASEDECETEDDAVSTSSDDDCDDDDDADCDETEDGTVDATDVEDDGDLEDDDDAADDADDEDLDADDDDAEDLDDADADSDSSGSDDSEDDDADNDDSDNDDSDNDSSVSDDDNAEEGDDD